VAEEAPPVPAHAHDDASPAKSALAQHRTDKPKKTLQILSDAPEEKKHVPMQPAAVAAAPQEPEEDEMIRDPSLSLIRKPSQFNFSENGTVYAACPKCGANYNRGATPYILHCNHTFCEDCMEDMARGTKISCPRCKQVTELGEQGIGGLPRNYALASLAEVEEGELHRRPTCMILEKLDASCPICYETYGDKQVPLNLGCGHTACDSCIMMIAEKAGSDKIDCPTCGKSVDLNDVSANLDLKKTVETVRLLKKHAQYRAEKKAQAQS